MCVRGRVCAREYNTTGFFVQGIKYQIHLVALVALAFCNALPALVAVRLVVASVGVCILELVAQ